VVVAHYKKYDLLNCWTSSLDISDYHADFHEGHDMSEQGTSATWRVFINGIEWQGNGMGAAWARHGHGILCVNRPLKKQQKFLPYYRNRQS